MIHRINGPRRQTPAPATRRREISALRHAIAAKRAPEAQAAPAVSCWLHFPFAGLVL